MLARVSSVTVTPAYGRDYRTKWEAMEAWQTGKDFVIEFIIPLEPCLGRYCSTRDFPGGTEVRVRYNKRTELVVITNTLQKEG